MIRWPLLVAGAALCLAAWYAPLHALGLGHFSAHMLRHMLVVAIASALIAAALPDLGARMPLSPLAATLIEFLVVWGWHLPVLHDAARASTPAYVVEQFLFLAAGLLVWASVLQPGRQLAGAGGLLLTSMHMTLLGALITLSPRLLYGLHGEGAAALADQQLGGMIMLAIGTPVYLIAGLALIASALRDDRHSGEEAV